MATGATVEKMKREENVRDKEMLDAGDVPRLRGKPEAGGTAFINVPHQYGVKIDIAYMYRACNPVITRRFRRKPSGETAKSQSG